LTRAVSVQQYEEGENQIEKDQINFPLEKTEARKHYFPGILQLRVDLK